MKHAGEHTKIQPEPPYSLIDGVVSRWLLRSIDWVFSNFDPRARPLRIKALVVVAQMVRTDRTHNGERIAVVALSVLSKHLNIPIRSAQRIVKDLTTEGAPLSVAFKQQGNNKSGTCYALTGTDKDSPTTEHKPPLMTSDKTYSNATEYTQLVFGNMRESLDKDSPTTEHKPPLMTRNINKQYKQ